VKINKRITYIAKRNPLTVYLYDKMLDIMCRECKNYIFVASTGRTGSVSLCKIFQAVKNCVSLHEPSPVMYNDCPPDANKEKYFYDLFYNLKRIYIKRAVKGNRCYVETNHQFVKNFISPAIEHFGNKIKIIHIVRDPVKVASSFYQINSIPGKSETAQYYLLDPKEKENLIQAADLLYDCDEFRNDIYKCLWYCYEVEARIKYAKQKYSHIEFYKLKTEDLNDKDIIRNMFQKFSLEYDEKILSQVIGVHANKRTHEKTRLIKYEECKIMNDKFVNVLENRYGVNFWVS